MVFWRNLLMNRLVLWALLLINIGGTIYGYVWYGSQLSETPPHFLPFVPDSPTASLFFVIVLIGFLLRTNIPYIEALALLTLFKYGVWAVVMNILTLQVTGYLPWQGYLLIVSHLAMAIQGILYSPFLQVKLRHIIVASIWTLHNDVIDYVFAQYPRYSQLHMYVQEIGYFTFWLSIFSIGLTYILTVHRYSLAKND